MSRHWPPALIVLVAALVIGLTSCRNTTSVGNAQRVSPSTLLDPTQGVKVPFTADGGALVVAKGEPPADVTKERALSRFHELRDPATKPTVIAVVSGHVSLRPGLGQDLIADRPAWVVVYTESGVFNCPAIETMPTAPPDASNLRAVIMMGEQPLAGTTGGPTIAPIFGYDGAGTGICGPSTEPAVLTVDQLLQGQG